METQSTIAVSPHFQKQNKCIYMASAIFVTLFCFWPTGIISIMKVTDIDDACVKGDALYLQTSKRAARKWMLVSVLFGVVVVSILSTVIALQVFC